MDEIYTFRSFSPDAIPLIEALQSAYVKRYAGAVQVPGQFYLSPYFENGHNVCCAVDAAGCLAAYAVYFAQNELAWVEIRAAVDLLPAEPVKRKLFGWLVEKARQGGQTRLAFQYLPMETEPVAFARSQGATLAHSIYAMQRSLKVAVPDYPMPEGFHLRRWRMQTPAEQQVYLEARNQCFPEAHTSLEEWQYFTSTPLWEHGLCVAGFQGDTLAGGVTVYWEPGSQKASTEYVFTLPPFRGKGLAHALLVEALRYLVEQGLQIAGLEVWAANTNALTLYQSLGYQLARESQVWVVEIPQGR